MKKITAVIAAIAILTAVPVTAAYGADRESTPVQTEKKADTVSAVGSVSKIFCTTAALQLYEQELLDIDAPVTDYVPEFTMQDERYKDITVRMLMNHTSGLMGMVYDDMMLYDDIDTAYHDRFIRYLKNSRLKADPGTLATYSNDGFTLLEIVVERVSGESFTDYVENHISKPLKLENTGTAAKMYGSENTANIFVGGVPYDTDYCMAFGSGGIMSTASELCKFGTAFFRDDETLLGQLSKDEMQKNNARDKYEGAFGLGWDAVDISKNWTTSEDVQIMFKGGSLLHQYAGLMVAPDEQISVSVTMNGAGPGEATMLTESLMISALAEKGITVTLDEPKVMETADKVPEKYLKMADIYAREDGICRVEFSDGKYMGITEITSENPRTKWYMYTADDSFVLMALNIGGDDYIKKPFKMNILLAKVRAILNRYENTQFAVKESPITTGSRKIQIIDGLFLDTQSHCISNNGEQITLKALEYKMLFYFLEHRGKVITKDEFLQNVWEDEYVGEGTVAVHIRHLREKLEADPNEPKIIKTVWGVGYIMGEMS